jgi:hypothetical protein
VGGAACAAAVGDRTRVVPVWGCASGEVTDEWWNRAGSDSRSVRGIIASLAAFVPDPGGNLAIAYDGGGTGAGVLDLLRRGDPASGAVERKRVLAPVGLQPALALDGGERQEKRRLNTNSTPL